MSPELLLEKWSKEVMDSFLASNTEFTDTNPTAIGLAKSVDELKPVVLGLKTSNDLLVKELGSVAKELAMKTAAVSLYQEELAKIKEKLRITNQRLTNANVKLSCIKTPDPVKRRMDTFDDDDDEPVAKQLKFGIELPSPLPTPSQGVDDMEDMEQEKDYSPK
ncbi:unnamed protein product, partial [Cylindrotheca closterium]